MLIYTEICYLWLIIFNSVDYILLDCNERKRLNIQATPKLYPTRIVRAPVPWSASFNDAKNFCLKQVFTCNPMTVELQKIWQTE